ncbi:MAG TPA: hypothetical protein PK852_02420 [Mesotoga prima]|uniref:hypothetical protein n=1 Tax=Mesotoga prima TaxID=1184387 RepID=UPI002CD9925B|nr:hypothetical protein [Mesotoga prima]HPE52949.1 hypothetical protein [Mesotoga prima]
MLANSVELTIHRKGTLKFIAADPTVITLTPVYEDFVNGTKTLIQLSERDPQTFKVIWSGSIEGLVSTGDTNTHRFDFVLVGPYDAEVAIGDYWVTDDGQKNVIEWLAPSNGYEVKAGGVSHGRVPV